MSREKQIEEMAKTMCAFYGTEMCYECRYCCDCHIEKEANRLYNAGYRKQSEGEWIEQVRVSKEGKPLLRHYKCNLCGVYLATQANFCPNCGAKMFVRMTHTCPHNIPNLIPTIEEMKGGAE